MSSIRRALAIIPALMLMTLGSGSALADVAPDPTIQGPLATTNAEYQMLGISDPEVSDRAVDYWAVVHRPKDLSAPPYPVVIFLHGNHGTCGIGSNPRQDNNCQYTTLGTCPAGYVVTPNHRGYDYLADNLASWGYVVVSVNANRGITCRNDGPSSDRYLIRARGRLVLRHLQLLSTWNTSGGTPESLGVDLQGMLDLSNVGLMGHSRGGEGVRAAYSMYRDVGSPWPAQIPEPVTFPGVFEIGPVDGQATPQVNAGGTKWNVLLPMCDGDVADLQGVKAYDRALRIFNEDPPTQKSSFAVWGTNHNFYNSEWQQSDSGGCTDHPRLWAGSPGSADQRTMGKVGVLAFIRANIGAAADPTFNQNFNPDYDLPTVASSLTRVTRSFSDSPNSSITTVFEDFSGSTGTSESGFSIATDGLSQYIHGGVPNHSPVQRAALISWSDPGGFLQTNWAADGSGTDISGYKTLDLRVSRQFNLSLNGPILSVTNFSIQLVQGDGTLSNSAQLTNYTELTGPVGGTFMGQTRHPILQTARIPLGDFGAVDLTNVRGVQVTFDDTASGAIYLANIRLSTLSGSGAPVGMKQAVSTQNLGVFEQTIPEVPAVFSEGNVVYGVRSKNGLVEVELFTPVEFPVTDSALYANLNGQTSVGSYFVNGDTHRVVFLFNPDQISDGPITVRYHDSSPTWNFGMLDSRAFRP
jgi:hypothetical protein